MIKWGLLRYRNVYLLSIIIRSSFNPPTLNGFAKHVYLNFFVFLLPSPFSVFYFGVLGDDSVDHEVDADGQPHQSDQNPERYDYPVPLPVSITSHFTYIRRYRIEHIE